MGQVKEHVIQEKETEIEEKELKKIIEAYKGMTPPNRLFMVSALSMLLASQEEERTDSVK